MEKESSIELIGRNVKDLEKVENSESQSVALMLLIIRNPHIYFLSVVYSGQLLVYTTSVVSKHGGDQ